MQRQDDRIDADLSDIPLHDGAASTYAYTPLEEGSTRLLLIQESSHFSAPL